MDSQAPRTRESPRQNKNPEVMLKPRTAAVSGRKGMGG